MSKIKLTGDSSGYVEISAPNAAGNNTLELPATGSKIVVSDGSDNINVAGIVTASSLYTTSINDLNYPSAGPLSNRNLIINGAMQVAQRGTSSTAGAYGTVDRFEAQLNGGTFTQSQEDVVLTDLPFTQDGHTKFFRMTNDSVSTAAGSFRNFQTTLEAQDIRNSGWKYTDSSSFITLSFWVRTSVSQTFYAQIRSNDGTAQAYRFEITKGNGDPLDVNTWTKVTKTFPGNSSLQFDNDNGAGLGVNISAFWGTNFTDSGVTLDSWSAYTSGTRFPDMETTWADTVGATFDITGVQLEVGERATPFEHRSYGDELLRCQRYCEIWQSGSAFYSSPGAGYNSLYRSYIPFKVEKRTTPAVSTYGIGGYPNNINQVDTDGVGNDSVTYTIITQYGFRVENVSSPYSFQCGMSAFAEL